MNSYYNCLYNLLTNIWIHINVWIYIMSVHTTLFAHVKTWARFHMYIWITMSHVINSLIITLNLLILIKFSRQHPTTSMRNWVCPHKSYCRAGCDGYLFSQQRGCDYHLKMEWECLLQCQDRNETRDETTGGSQSDGSTTSVPSFLQCSYPCRTQRRTQCLHSADDETWWTWTKVCRGQDTIRNWQQGDIDGSWNCEIVMTSISFIMGFFKMIHQLKQDHKFTLNNTI